MIFIWYFSLHHKKMEGIKKIYGRYHIFYDIIFPRTLSMEAQGGIV